MQSLDTVLPQFALVLAQPSSDGRRKARTDVTIQNYLGALRRLEREAGPLLDTPDAVRARLEQWRADLHARYRAGAISASRIACDVSALRTFYKELAALRLYGTDNPAREVPSMSRDRKLPEPMPRTDVQKLFAVPDLRTSVGRRDRAMLELYLNNLRNSEVATLTTSRVHLIEEGEQHTLGVKPFGKGRKERVVPLHPTSARLLALHLLDRFAAGEWPQWPVEAAEGPDKLLAYVRWLLTRLVDGTERVFVTSEGTPVTKRWANRRFRTLCAEVGLTSAWGPHALRHRFGASMVDAGVDIRVIQELMGHNDIRTTQIYTHVAGGVRQAATSLLDTPAVNEEVFAWTS